MEDILDDKYPADMFTKCFQVQAFYPTQVSTDVNNLMIGGPGQDLRNFQVVPIPILSILTYSTSSPHDILKVSKKKHNLPVGRVKCDVVFLVSLLTGV